MYYYYNVPTKLPLEKYNEGSVSELNGSAPLIIVLLAS